VTFDEKLSPTKRLALGAFTVVMAAGGFAAGRVAFNPDRAVVQPIAFNHQKHVKVAGMDCSACHQYYADHQHSGLPDLALCTGCHQQPMTKSPEEAKLIKLAASPEPPAFRKLFRLPDHVYYSHRRHVTVAKLPCTTCHGAIADSTAPPPRPLVQIVMQTCIDCHTRQSVPTNCIACHR
jgi:Cytochrome c7 and related cytochrome c